MNAVLRNDDAIEVSVDAGDLLLAVRGDVDTSSAPLLRSVMRGVVDGGRSLVVVVDLAKVTFLGAAGLGVLAEAASWLRSAGGTLRVRAASPLAIRLLQISRMDALVGIDPPERVRPLGPEDSSTGTSEIERRLDVVSELVQLGSTLTATAIVDKALQLVTVLAAAAVDGADGVSVSLERHARFSTVAWSNETVLEMDRHQYQTGEGPCLDAATTGHWFHIESLGEEERWPAFVPRAMEEGIASVLSTPLTTPAGAVGALNIYSNTEGVFGERQLALASLFAEQASEIVLAGLDDEQTGARLGHALVERELIAQAQGVLMARHRISPISAASELFRAARRAEITVRDQAALVVDSVAPDSAPTTAGAGRG